MHLKIVSVNYLITKDDGITVVLVLRMIYMHHVALYYIWFLGNWKLIYMFLNC